MASKKRRAKREIHIPKHAGATPVHSWWPRFWAWVIDIIVLSLVLLVIFPPRLENLWAINTSESIAGSLIVFLYWMVTDSGGRQSIGKKALGLKQVKKNGSDPDMVSAAISAFGKAYLLPIDMIIGVLARPGKKQRLFNIISDTVVVRVK